MEQDDALGGQGTGEALMVWVRRYTVLMAMFGLMLCLSATNNFWIYAAGYVSGACLFVGGYYAGEGRL